MNFKLWLEEQQMMMFSTKPVELYHGSNTGADNSSLNSLLKDGIKPTVAQGYGQGAGFYVWSDKNSAINHTKAIASGSITTNAKTDGMPMIVTVEAIADPEKWDLDYESNQKALVIWLHDNFEKVSQALEGDNIGLTNRFNREIIDPNDQRVMAKGVSVKMDNSRKTLYAHNDSSLRVGEFLGALVNRLKEKDPQTVNKFEELFFANMKPGVAIKYVGTETLKPKKIEIYKDGQWIQA